MILDVFIYMGVMPDALNASIFYLQSNVGQCCSVALRVLLSV
jgi:hypothetical protein